MLSPLSTLFLGAAIVASVLVTFFRSWSGVLRRVSMMEKFPGPVKHMFFGNALQFEREPSAFVEQVMSWSHRFHGVMCLWIGPVEPALFLYRPDVTEVLLSSSKQLTKSRVYDFVHPWLGTGLLTSTGEKWKSRRRLLTPTFHFKILNDFLQVFDEQAELLTSILKGNIKGKTNAVTGVAMLRFSPPSKKLNAGNKAFDIFPYITSCALDIITKTSMGTSINAQKDSTTDYVKAVLRMSELIQARQKSPWLWPEVIYNLTAQGREHNRSLEILHGFTNQVIDERIKERRCSSSPEAETQRSICNTRKRRIVAFLDHLLDVYDSGEIDREGLREEVDTFMFEGHDTTAAGIVWAVQLLGDHQEIQKRAQKEVDEFFESRPETLTIDSLKDLKYLERTIKESLRIFPSVSFFARKLSEDCEFDGKIVPKGTTVGVSPLALHRNPDVWPDPFKFDPDRFLPENSTKRHPYAYVPFSAGSRNCIGQKFALLEEKIVLAFILYHFTIVSREKSDEIKTCAELITRPKDGIYVTLIPRIHTE